MIKQMITAIVLATSGLFSISTSALTVFIDLDGDTLFDSLGSYVVGDVFTAGVYADVDDQHGGLAGFGVRLNYGEPPIRVNAIPSPLDNVVIAPQWNFIPLQSVAAGTVTAGASQLASSSVGASVHLFDVTFQATALGTSILTMIDEIPNFGDFAGFDGFDYDVSGELQFLTTRVEIVPIPSAMILFASGLLGIISFARRCRMKS